MKHSTKTKGNVCDELRHFVKKMISLLVIRYWESTEGKQLSQAVYKKIPDGWPKDAWFGDPSKCNKPERDTMLNLLLDMCLQQGIDLPDEWLSLSEKYRKTLDINCCKVEKEKYADDLRVWVKNLKSKEIVEKTFDRLLDVPAQDKNMIIAQIYGKLKRHVPDLHSDMLGSQTVREENNVDLLVHNLEYDEQTADTSLNLSNPCGKGDATQKYVDCNSAIISSFNDTTIKKNSMYQMPTHSLETTYATTSTSTVSAENTNNIEHDQWLDDIRVDSLSWNFTDKPIFSITDYLKIFDNSEKNFDHIEQNNNYIEQNFDNISHVDDSCRNKTNHNKRKRTIDVCDDMRPPLTKHPAMSGCIDGGPRLETETTHDENIMLEDIMQVIKSDANYPDLWD